MYNIFQITTHLQIFQIVVVFIVRLILFKTILPFVLVTVLLEWWKHTNFQQACNLNELPSNLQSCLVAYYPFCGNADDQSVNLNNGIVNGASLTLDRHGNANSAYEFDGIDDYISVPYSSSIGISNTYSMSVWFLMDGGGCNPRIFEMHDSPNCGGYNLAFNGTSNSSRTLHASNYGPCGSEISLTSYNQPISSLSWHHMVITADGNTGEGKLYLDGILVHSITGPTFSNISYYGGLVIVIFHQIDVIGGEEN